jgi:hypothetical protein
MKKRVVLLKKSEKPDQLENTDSGSTDDPIDINRLILKELQAHTDYLHKMDWKLWVIMNNIKTVATEMGYSVGPNSSKKPLIEQGTETNG